MKLKTKIILLFSMVIVLGTTAMGGFSIYTLQSKATGVVPPAVYDALVQSFRNSVILFGVIGLVLAILTSWLVAELNARPLVRLIEVARRVSGGDLRVEQLKTNRKDEIGELSVAMNAMVENLRLLIVGVNNTSTQVAQASDALSASTESSAHASEEITSTIQQVASGAEEQLRVADDSEKAIREMAFGVAQVAETAVVVAEASFDTAQEAEQGNQSIQEAIRQMDMIYQTVDQSSAGIKALEERSHEVGKIVEVITSIAGQTNLLALNAAIEASRAGEHGRGFSVVADEIRKLAEEAGKSAGQIATLIQSIRGDMVHSVEAMNQMIHEVNEGTEAVKVANEAFQRILLSAQQVSVKIQDVSASSQEMSAGSQMVIQTVGTVTEIANQSAMAAKRVASSSAEQLATMEGISHSAESLSKMAHELQEMIEKFHV